MAGTTTGGYGTARYTSVAIFLHWTIFILMAVAVYIGWGREGMPKEQIPTAMMVHKSIGITVLILSIFRLVWRNMNPPPPLPAGMSRRDVIIMKATHHSFYVLMIGIPLMGWIISSIGSRPLTYFNLFPFPKLPLNSMGTLGGMETLGEVAGFLHSKLVWVGIILMLLHAGAAIKHQYIDKDGVLARMLPFLK